MDYNNNYNPYTGQNQNNQYAPEPVLRNPGQSMATASMILGVVGLFTIFTVYIPLICGGLAVILAILSRGYGKKMLLAARVGIGTAIGAVVLICSIIFSLVGILLASSGDDLVNFGKAMDEQFEQQTGIELEDILGQSYEDIMRDYTEIMGK
ncbi:hypothetical protein D5282_17700 [bacterium 1xD8-48]|jgi:hypothetical protein|nr:hypothetical protein [Lachnospiraceae bacterium]MCI9327689.1 hypothetical protein [Lachnospiraceae bacterium]NBJ99092.1 hypothetical protein [bacterium 1xD8-48]